MVNDRSVLILYANAICNLKCTYCYIDKNPVLMEIDKIMDESYKGNYYLEFAKEVFPDPQQVEEIQIWGGEPTLAFERIADTVVALIKHYTNVHKVMFSTNLAYDNCIDNIFHLVRKVNSCDRQINFDFQLSLDGPTYITDVNRGIGTTDKFTRNFSRLIAEIDPLLNECPNITINAFNKSTLDIASIESLQDKEHIIKYYRFLEAYRKISVKATNPRFHFNATVPNTACPLPITVDLGKKFANLCRLTREVERENKEQHYFEYLKTITPFVSDRCDKDYCNKGVCGSGKFCIGLLPNRMISTCHNGFTEVLAEYKEYALNNKDSNSTLQKSFFSDNFSNNMVFPYEQLTMYEKQVEELYNRENKNMMNAYVSQIQFLAVNHQIDRKYLKLENAIDGALFVFMHTSYCMRDNLNTSGTKIIAPANLFKLLLNGAKEYIETSITEKEDN